MTEQGDSAGTADMTQAQLNDLAKNLDIRYSVLDNLIDGHPAYRASLTFTNKGDTELKYGSWAIYFCHIRMIEPGRLPSENGITFDCGLHLYHINGCLFRLRPTASFKPLKKGDSATIPFKGQYFSVARYDILPNWYIAVSGLTSKVITCTASEDLDFVDAFDTPAKWKRFDYVLGSNKKRRFDFYNPFTPEVRFKNNDARNLGKADWTVVPTPVHIDGDKSKQPLQFDTGQWTVCSDSAFKQEASFLADRIGAASPSLVISPASQNAVLLIKEDSTASVPGKQQQSPEAYSLTVDPEKGQVRISAKEPVGIFWGIQTLLGLTSDGYLPIVSIHDVPRYDYRGMHLDVSRNFHSVASVLRLIEVMSMYKLNVLHFHLTDDEGWRLQIPGLEELTEIGSKRSHDMGETASLLPLLGSGPSTESSGSGFFTVEDYREILRYAAVRHVEVIPEIDMPGHCHAAVRAMQARYARLKAAGDMKAAEQYMLSDLSSHASDKSTEARSSQMFSENSLNPGLPSTYEFIRKVMEELQKMHADIQPLHMFHFGGDEVPYRAWEDSPACHALIDCGEVTAIKDLMEYFVIKVAKIAHELGLEVGAWQDGIVHKFEPPFPRHKFPNKKVAVYAWKNVWETGMAFDVHKLANEDYEVVLSPGTHLYFDHPQEPDPEERGLYWACRYTDLHKVFSFAPDNLFSNADVRLTGQAISPDELKAILEDEDFVPLTKPENIVGMQGQLWTELVRTSSQLDAMIFPRLLALAERAWHEAPWESLQRDDPKRKQEREEDWAQFVNRLGYRELSRLDKIGVEYYLPPPGARLREDGQMAVNSQIPGLPLQYSTDAGQHWMNYSGPVGVGDAKHILLRTCSADGKRHSRLIKWSLDTDSKATS